MKSGAEECRLILQPICFYNNVSTLSPLPHLGQPPALFCLIYSFLTVIQSLSQGRLYWKRHYLSLYGQSNNNLHKDPVEGLEWMQKICWSCVNFSVTTSYCYPLGERDEDHVYCCSKEEHVSKQKEKERERDCIFLYEFQSNVSNYGCSIASI